MSARRRRWRGRRARGWRRRRATISRTVATRCQYRDRRNRQQTSHPHNASMEEMKRATRTPSCAKRVRCSLKLIRCCALVLLTLQRVCGKPRRDDRIATREPRPREQEEPTEEQRHADLRDAQRWPGAMIDGRHDFEIALQPYPRETHQRETHHGGGEQLRLHAE